MKLYTKDREKSPQMKEWEVVNCEEWDKLPEGKRSIVSDSRSGTWRLVRLIREMLEKEI